MILECEAYSITELSDLTGIPPNAIRLAVASGSIETNQKPHFKDGRVYAVISKDAAIDWLNRLGGPFALRRRIA
jgi:hypothetical protein